MIKQVCGKDILGRTAVYKWHKRSAQGIHSLKDEEHTGQLKTVRTELKIREVATFVCINCSQTVDEVAAATGITYGTCRNILSCVTQYCHFIPFQSQYSPQHPVLKQPQSMIQSMNQASHPHKTTGRITVLYILIFTFLDSRREDNGSGLKGSKH
jgi:hypothetical protein